MKRRDVLRTSGWAAVLGLTPEQAGAAAPKAGAPDPAVYTRIGGKPFINLTATYTINGGALSRPEVKRAMEEAGHWPVNLDELMDKAGQYLSKKLGSESAIVTNGAAAALTLGTAGCITGRDPEKLQQIPNLDGLKNYVVVPRQSRNAYDHAVRATGVRMVEVANPDELRNALSQRTAAIMMLGTGEANGPIKLEHLVAEARKHGVPILVDAAAELPHNPNPYLSRGADLVAYSGGKFLRGPQPSGLLIGRKDLIAAAWANASPHHAFGRSLKVGKEEIMGLVAAIDTWTNNYDLEGEYNRWRAWLKQIGDRIEPLGVKTTLRQPAGASPFPTLGLEWSPDRIGLTAGEIGKMLLEGTPRIMSHGEGDGFAFHIRPVAMKEGEAALVAARLEQILKAAPKGRAEKKLAPPAMSVSGPWRVTIDFLPGTTTHELQLDADGNALAGSHKGRIGNGKVKGTIDGANVAFSSSWRYEGQTLHYSFKGRVEADRMSGEVSMGEYGTALWRATRS